MTTVPLGIPTPRGLSVDRPDVAGLVDRFGRVATDLRVSVTDRCNLRCTYCMPAEGLDWMPDAELLSTTEMSRLIGIAVAHLGVEEIRFTGGEPLLFRGLEELIGRAADLVPRPQISLTTNALGLERRAQALAVAGLDRVNISLDTVDRAAYAAITRRDRLPAVLAGIEACRTAGIGPIKVNAVLLRGVNDDGACDLLRYCMDGDIELRFIEQMPIDSDNAWAAKEMMTAEEILAILQSEFSLRPASEPRGSAPAELWTVDGSRHRVGVIASVTRPFCGDCDRVRLTADGSVRSCLFGAEEFDLRGLLRSSEPIEAVDLAIAQKWREAMWRKQPGHGINDPGFLHPTRPMSAIGG